MDRTTNKLIYTLIIMSMLIGITAVVKYNRAEVPPEQPNVQIPVQPPVQPPPEPKVTLEDAISSITAADCKEGVSYLADYDKFRGRSTGSEENAAAAKWIKEKLESYGLKTEYQAFSARGRQTNNVIGYIEGTEKPNEIIVMGAHFDHISSSPGADDNASGTVGIMECAQAFGMLQDRVKRTVVFILFSGEEMGLLGSSHYVNNPAFPKGSPDIKKHIFMMNMDMIGRMDRTNYVMKDTVDVGQLSPDVEGVANQLKGKYPGAARCMKRGAGGSDQTPFLNKGVVVAWMFTGTHSDYHRRTDTADKINYEGMEEISRFAFELTWRIDQSINAPVNNETRQWKVYHDHDHPQAKFPYVYPYE